MKSKNPMFMAIAVSPLFFLSSAFGQGTLTPPGAPGPTMLTLSQMEPRTPISGQKNITQPGSYYLTTNITIAAGSAITINANNVTLDLNGFTISSTASPAAGVAIYIGAVVSSTNVSIINGFIVGSVTNGSSGVFNGSGFGYGVYGGGSNLQVKNVAVYGCLYDGINIGQNSTVVEACTVNTAGGIGIFAQSISDSAAVNCGTYGIDAIIANNCYGSSLGNSDSSGLYAFSANNCYGYNTGASSGYYASGMTAYAANNCYADGLQTRGLYASSANNCQGVGEGNGDGLDAYYTATGSYGISEGNGEGLNSSSATGCYGASFGSGTGLSVYNAENCYGYSNTGDGLYASQATGCYGSSSSSTGLYAIYIAIGCTGKTSGGGYGLFAGNTAMGCVGYSTGSAGLGAYIANGCFSSGPGGSGLSDAGITYKYNMP